MPFSGRFHHHTQRRLPISACGLRLDDEAVRVAVGLRLGTNLYIPHSCPCGLQVGATGFSQSVVHADRRQNGALSLIAWIIQYIVHLWAPIYQPRKSLLVCLELMVKDLTAQHWYLGRQLNLLHGKLLLYTLADMYFISNFELSESCTPRIMWNAFVIV
jgi:hypothetical protein